MHMKQEAKTRNTIELSPDRAYVHCPQTTVAMHLQFLTLSPLPSPPNLPPCPYPSFPARDPFAHLSTPRLPTQLDSVGQFYRLYTYGWVLVFLRVDHFLLYDVLPHGEEWRGSRGFGPVTKVTRIRSRCPVAVATAQIEPSFDEVLRCTRVRVDEGDVCHNRPL